MDKIKYDWEIIEMNNETLEIMKRRTCLGKHYVLRFACKKYISNYKMNLYILNCIIIYAYYSNFVFIISYHGILSYVNLYSR